MINRIAQYLFGFSFLGGRSVYRFSKKVVKGAYNNIHSVLPYLSQPELLKWSEKTIDAVDSPYDLAIDETYNKTHIGGGNHRLFDGSHDLISMWKAVEGTYENDTFAQEVIAYVSAIIKDVSTTKGLPFLTRNKDNYDIEKEWVADNIPGASKDWYFDLQNGDVFEVLTASIGIFAAFFHLNRGDKEKLSEILGSMGIISIITANPLMGMAVVGVTTYSYVKKKQELSKKEALKGVGYATISLAIFKILTIHVLIKLFIVICVLRVVRGQKLIGYDFIKNIFNHLRKTNKTKLLPGNN